MVFRYPVNPSMDYIKRIIGIPGDTVTYRDKKLTVNNIPVVMEPEGEYTYVESGLNYVYNRRFRESLEGHKHNILINPDAPDIQMGGVHPFPHQQNCSYMTVALPVRCPRNTTSPWVITGIAVVIVATGDLCPNATSSARPS